MIKNDDVTHLVNFISDIPFSVKILPQEFGYSNPVMICLDAVLSINRKYETFVIPRLNTYKKNFPFIHTLKQLSDQIHQAGYEGFCDIWNYQHIERVKILDNLTEKFILYAEEINESNDLLAMQDWAKNSSIEGYLIFGIKGIGLATYQYLRMMLGIPTTKPDVHIRKAVYLALQRHISDIEAILLIEKASEVMELPATMVDHNLWKYFSSKKN